MQRFEWDETKTKRYLRKHGIDFEDAITVFRDEYVVIELDRYVDGEARWQALGMIDGAIIVVVVHGIREEGLDELVRIISARRAEPHERRRYGKNRS
jgi:uncharacterized DUF497 family protein